tara:strand:+ start:47 stop:1447 length:1401 start_codon:yes stop_codon:yes gene_type:complete
MAKKDELKSKHLPHGVETMIGKDGKTRYYFKGKEYDSPKDIPAPTWNWLNKAGENISNSRLLQKVAPTLQKIGELTELPGEEAWANQVGLSAQKYNVPYNVGKTIGYGVYPGFGELKGGTKALTSNKLKLQPALATVGPDSLKIPKTVEPVIDGSKPLQMTADEAATTWGKVTKVPYAELGITSAQKGADHGAMSRIVRYVESGRFNKLDHRNKKTIISSQIENSPIEYLVKYHGGDLLDAESHHILDIDFWGRALDTKNNKAVSTVLWKDGVHIGNAKKNIVWAWAARKGSMDHNTLHALYNKIPSRQDIETLMANGRWYTMKADAQAKLLREVAYDQHRLTNNFMNMKLNFILKEHPELALLHPEHLKNKILKNPKKYGEIAVINPKDPNEVQQLLMTLQEAPYTGRVHPKVREVFGLETPKATAKKYSGSITQKEFNKRLSHRLNKVAKKERERSVDSLKFIK